LFYWLFRDDKKDSRKPKKPYKYWDVAPMGYEHMTPIQYKALQGKVDNFCIVCCRNAYEMLEIQRYLICTMLADT